MSGHVSFPFHITRSPLLGIIRRPAIPATLSGPVGNARVSLLVDSGADVSLLPRGLGSFLGLSNAGAPRGLCRGIGRGVLAYFLCPVGIQIGHMRARIRVGWCEADGFPPLLGRLDLFDLLDIEFRQSSNCILLRRARG